jgi:hypothetical protein
LGRRDLLRVGADDRKRMLFSPIEFRSVLLTDCLARNQPFEECLPLPLHLRDEDSQAQAGWWGVRVGLSGQLRILLSSPLGDTSGFCSVTFQFFR